jgi:hypothetical protein
MAQTVSSIPGLFDITTLQFLHEEESRYTKFETSLTFRTHLYPKEFGRNYTLYLLRLGQERPSIVSLALLKYSFFKMLHLKGLFLEASCHNMIRPSHMVRLCAGMLADHVGWAQLLYHPGLQTGHRSEGVST